MSRRDPAVRGPEPATVADIPALNRLFSEAFTERYQRDGMSGVRVPPLNPQVWRYAIEDAADGALVWRDGEGEIVAFNMVHCSGREGWMGPIAVRADAQGRGLGTRMVEAGVARLRARQALTIGLETMPRTVENIGFYSRLGFLPGHLTVTFVREPALSAAPGARRLSAAGPDQPDLLAACARLTSALRNGADYTRELRLTQDLGLGDTTVLEADGAVRGFALWHAAPLAAGRPREELRVLKLVAADLAVFETLVAAVDAEARREGAGHCSYRAQAAEGDAYRTLVRLGSRVAWTDLRMTLAGFGEPETGPGIVFSNWEI